MQLLDDRDVRERLSWGAALDALEHAFRDPRRFQTPERVALPAPQGGAFLTMPCADADGWFGVKQVAVLPGNRAAGRPGVQAHYTLFDPHGTPVLSAAATELTRLRTAAVSALAARLLAPPEARTLLLCGTGGLAPWMAEAHCRVRDYARVRVWGRDSAAAEATASEVERRLVPGSARVEAVADLAAAFAGAEVISCATSARRPFVRGAWLRPGQHLDLVGAFAPDMAEADPEAVRRSRVFVDDEAAARAEAGELLQAESAGWRWKLAGTLSALLTAGPDAARGTDGAAAPSLFKSVGLAFEDLAVARLLLD